MSSLRAHPGARAASMTEVVLTFDNEDGTFPLELAEVSIARRAYRSGENEYLLNGNRVRLRRYPATPGGSRHRPGHDDRARSCRSSACAAAGGSPCLAGGSRRRAFRSTCRSTRRRISSHECTTIWTGCAISCWNWSRASPCSETQAGEARKAETLQQELAQAMHAWYAAQLAELVAEERTATQELAQVQTTLATLDSQIAGQVHERERLEQAMQEQEQGMNRPGSAPPGIAQPPERPRAAACSAAGATNTPRSKRGGGGIAGSGAC